MIKIKSPFKSPYINLSLEEILLKDENIKEDIFMLYQNENTIVFGRNQNVLAEVNIDYVKKEKIKLIRRVSGGGTVYHDKGNINFSFITNNKENSYQDFLEPIIKFLNSIGVNAKFKGKNDVVVDGFKISGNAQYKYKDRMFHHGTLLFDVDLSKLGKALKPHPLKLQSKGIKSASARVKNIKEFVEKEMSPQEFIDLLFNFIDGKEFDVSHYKVNEIKALENIRKSHDWNFGKSPEFDVLLEEKFNGGLISLWINIKQGNIKDIKFTGDFMSSIDFEKINSLFINQNFTIKNIEKILISIDNFKDYFGSITIEELLSLFKCIDI